jgi:glycine dehydrogenase
VFPHVLAVLETRAAPLGIRLSVKDLANASVEPDVFGVYLQSPDDRGEIADLRPLIDRIHAAGALAAVGTDLLALALIVPPGEAGADVVVGNAQRFGVPLGYGGPHAAFFATREAFVRQAPGRIIGVSIDSQKRPAYRMALQTREQHIRREKATSNICTAQVLLAIMASAYAVYHGPEGIRRIATRIRDLTGALAAGLGLLGHELLTDTFCT